MAALDYADLLVLGARLVEEHPRVRRRLAEVHRWVLVDELHDVNPVQARLVEALAAEGSHLVAVADPDQSIYGWRGADPEVVDRFAGAEGTRVFPLQTNYRSTPEVVALAQETLPAGNPYGKRLVAHRPASGAPPVVAHLASVQDEAAFVTQRIADLLTGGRSPGEIAVLYRAHHHSVELQLALNAAGVEFELFSGARFVESAHVKDVLAFCRLRHNPRDELAWHRALRLFERVGQAVAARAWAQIGARPDPLAAAAELRPSGTASAGLAAFAATVADVARLERPEEIVLRVARSEWYRDRLQRTYPNWRDREGDLARLAEVAARAPDLDRFLGDLQLAERIEADEDVSGPARRVALSSVHQAKGLEWPVVFVLQLEAGSFPSGWAVSEGNLDEEERLFYVAVTRAADELYLCRPIAARRGWDTGADALVLNSGQGFLDRDLAGLVEEWSVR
jgi:DNA helicase-2/ATP-dependent DNA helicase PcrA